MGDVQFTTTPLSAPPPVDRARTIFTNNEPAAGIPPFFTKDGAMNLSEIQTLRQDFIRRSEPGWFRNGYQRSDSAYNAQMFGYFEQNFKQIDTNGDDLIQTGEITAENGLFTD
ncbi:MAG: hypothetical protein SFZ03_03430 [Candidatus Melainabacteria bacterium]|nr:hypothetical protein [Candidatus Melainabacteria bacterium]